MTFSFITWVNNEDEYRELTESIVTAMDDRPNHWFELVPVRRQDCSMLYAYGEGQALAKGRIKVYVHQDVLITKRLISRLYDVLTHDKEIGFAGVIGNTHEVADSWWHAPHHTLHGIVRQLDKTGRRKPQDINFDHYEGYAAQMDGLLLATARHWEFPVWPGHHFADLVMCHEALKAGFKNYIVDAHITHKSWGEDTSNAYIDNRERFRRYLQGK